MTITASKLREDVYNLVDQVLESGRPLVIERKGRRLILMPERKEKKLSRLIKREILKGTLDSIVHLDWSKNWKHDLP
jgi:PHD/YefM family antitoxin component YafN of YafNO toxin-antitoxin module